MGIQAAFMKVNSFLVDAIAVDLNFVLNLRFSVPFVIYCSGFCIDLIALHLYCENVCSASCLLVLRFCFIL